MISTWEEQCADCSKYGGWKFVPGKIAGRNRFFCTKAEKVYAIEYFRAIRSSYDDEILIWNLSFVEN
jgi:hypothetical protein